MLVSLEINDNKSKVFLEFLNSLDFVKIEKSELNNDEYSNLINDRLEEYKNNSDSAVELKEVLKNLKTKYGF